MRLCGQVEDSADQQGGARDASQQPGCPALTFLQSLVDRRLAGEQRRIDAVVCVALVWFSIIKDVGGHWISPIGCPPAVRGNGGLLLWFRTNVHRNHQLGFQRLARARAAEQALRSLQLIFQATQVLAQSRKVLRGKRGSTSCPRGHSGTTA